MLALGALSCGCSGDSEEHPTQDAAAEAGFPEGFEVLRRVELEGRTIEFVKMPDAHGFIERGPKELGPLLPELGLTGQPMDLIFEALFPGEPVPEFLLPEQAEGIDGDGTSVVSEAKSTAPGAGSLGNGAVGGGEQGSPPIAIGSQDLPVASAILKNEFLNLGACNWDDSVSGDTPIYDTCRTNWSNGFWVRAYAPRMIFGIASNEEDPDGIRHAADQVFKIEAWNNSAGDGSPFNSSWVTKDQYLLWDFEGTRHSVLLGGAGTNYQWWRVEVNEASGDVFHVGSYFYRLSDDRELRRYPLGSSHHCSLATHGICANIQGGCDCRHAEGDCDATSECSSGNTCRTNVGASFGMSPDTDVCLDSSCGTPGSSNFCSAACPCGHGGGDCESDSDCGSGHACVQNNGPMFGRSASTDVCVYSVCKDRDPGATNYCTDSCPCGEGGGDCDSNAECLPGLICRQNVGANYGFDPSWDICEM